MDEDVRILVELDVEIDQVKKQINQLQKYIDRVNAKPASLVTPEEINQVDQAKTALADLERELARLQAEKSPHQEALNARMDELDANIRRAAEIYDTWGEELMPAFFGANWEQIIPNWISELSYLSSVVGPQTLSPFFEILEDTTEEIQEATTNIEQATEAAQEFVETIEEIPTEPIEEVSDKFEHIIDVLETVQDRVYQGLIGGLRAVITPINNVLNGVGNRFIALVTGELPTGTTQLNSLFGTLGRTIRQTFTNASRQAAPAIKSIKRVGLAMLGVRSTFTAVRKAMNAYMSQNEEAAARLESIWVAIGNAIGPAVEYIIDLITKAFGYINSFVKALTGIDMVANANAKAIENQAKSTKKLNNEQRRQLAAFDEMNRLNEESSSDSSSSGPTLIEVPDFAIGDGGVGALLAENLNKIFAEIDWDAIKELLTDGVKQLVDDLNTFTARLNFKGLGETISKGLSLIPQAFNVFWKNFNFYESGKGFMQAVQAFFENIDWASMFENWVLKKIAKIDFLAGVIEGFNLQSLINRIGEILSNIDWGDLITRMGSAIGRLLKAILGQMLNLAGFIGEAIYNAWQTVKEYFDGYIEKAKEEYPDNMFGLAGNIIDGLLMGIIDAVKGIWGWIKEHIFTPFIEGFKSAFGIASPSKVMEEQGHFIIEGLYNGLLGIWDAVKGIFTDLVSNILQKLDEIFFGEEGLVTKSVAKWEEFKENIASIVDNIKTTIIDKWEALKQGLSDRWESIKQGAVDAWESIKSTFSPVTNWFKEKFGNAWEKVKAVFSGDSDIFTGIKEGISTTFKTIVNKLIDGINKVVRTPFNKINSMLNTIKSTSILGIKPFDGLWGWSPVAVPQIPKLAQGAVIPPNKEFMAILGDQKSGTNIEAPLDTIVDAFKQVLGENTNQPIELTVKLDGKTLSRELTKATKKLDFSYNRG